LSGSPAESFRSTRRSALHIRNEHAFVVCRCYSCCIGLRTQSAIVVCQQQLHAAFCATLVVRMQVQVRLLVFWSAASSNCNAASQTVRQLFLEQTLDLSNLIITKIQANAVSNRHPSFSAGFKLSPFAPSGIDSRTANSKRQLMAWQPFAKLLLCASL